MAPFQLSWFGWPEAPRACANLLYQVWCSYSAEIVLQLCQSSTREEEDQEIVKLVLSQNKIEEKKLQSRGIKLIELTWKYTAVVLMTS